MIIRFKVFTEGRRGSSARMPVLGRSRGGHVASLFVLPLLAFYCGAVSVSFCSDVMVDWRAVVPVDARHFLFCFFFRRTEVLEEEDCWSVFGD